MSSNQTKTDGKTASARKGSASLDQQKRMTSITRKMHGYLLRKKFFRSLGTDLLTGVLLVIGWCVEQEFSVLGSIAAGRSRFFTVREIAASPGAEFLYMITSGTGKTLLSVSFLYPFIAIACILGVLLAVQILGLLCSFYRAKQAIRKILAPINEIALKADELSRLSFSEDKYQMIEDALEHIDPENAEQGRPLSFGDSDLIGVEAAMNNLLLRMRDTMRQQSRFVNDASHELRTPIAVIQGYANMLDRWGKTDEKILDESITAIKNEADHMNYLVEQLLFLARGDAGRTSLSRQSVSTDAFIRDIYEESLMIDEKHRYRLKEGEASEVSVDPGLMKQAVRILIDNAAKYTPEGEEIILSYGKTDKGRSYLQVQDLGRGISESELPHIFERFFRADDVRASAGTGLGLSIAKWIVDKHGGHFEVLSRKDLGTRIRIVL
ncbi:MAG: HAMP domain-containing sensor histidine kinase [Lachnospiraceae bacterium]|nr:HAMP domain-containing sensor histidine kinase [Lachnospiraceae bacterium]